MLGLTVVRAESGAPASTGMRVGRNVPLVVPFVPLIEFLVASFGNKDMQRLGDLAASTRVVDAKPEKFGRGTYSWQLVLTMLACGIILGVLVPVIIQTMSGQ